MIVGCINIIKSFNKNKNFKLRICRHISRYLKPKNIAQKLGVDLYTDNNFGRVKLRTIFVVTKLALA